MRILRKAPTLMLDDGTVLMGSTLIIDYIEAISAPDARLLPQQAGALGIALRTIGLALAACEKGVQVVYERNLRPAEKLHQPWLERVTGQLLAACRELDRQMAAVEAPHDPRPEQAAIATAVAWSLLQLRLSDIVKPGDFPAIRACAERLEQTNLFKRYPII